MGKDVTLSVISTVLPTRLTGTVKNVCQGQACIPCLQNSSGHPTPPPSLEPDQRKCTLPHEDWQVDFTHMPSCASFKLVLVDAGTGWIQAEKVTTVARATLKGIIPGSDLTHSSQGDSGSSFTSQGTRSISRALGRNIICTLLREHCLQAKLK